MSESDRVWLMRRLDIEARACSVADSKVKAIRWGRVLAFLEVGIHFGWWSRIAATRYSDAVFFGGRKPNARRSLGASVARR